MNITPQSRTAALWLLFCLIIAPGCSDEGGASPAPEDSPDAATGDVEPDPTPDVDTPDAAIPEACVSDRRPMVLAHGFLASGDTYANHAMRFEANGFCLDRIFAFDWNTLDRDNAPEIELDAFIDAVLAQTGAEKVDLAGHSAGGGLGYTYLSEPTRAAKVAHYAHIASGSAPGPAGPNGEVPTLNLWSEADLIIDDRGDIEGAVNVMLSEEDHYAVATSEASFEALFGFFTDGEAPAKTTIEPIEGPLFASGRAVSLGENAPLAGGEVEIYAVSPDTGLRVNTEPDATLTTDDEGHWGPVEIEAGTHYEFKVSDPSGDSQPIHYYREPFVRTNPFVYLRTLPSPDSLAGQLLSLLPLDGEGAIVIVFMANRALDAESDSLTVDGLELATPELASAEQTTIALFLYDSDDDGETSGEPVALFGGFPFLNAVDAFFGGGPQSTIALDLNGRTLNVPAWPANSDGATIAVFE